MSDFIDSFEEIFNRLEGMGALFPEQMQVAMLLAAFGEKTQSPYGHIVAPMQNAGQDLYWENVTARLLQEFDEKQWNNELNTRSGSQITNHALVVSRPYAKKRFVEKRQRYKCGEKGHLMKKCPRKSGRFGKRNARGYLDNPRDESRANVGRATLLFATSENWNQKNVFLMDSGASDHMINDISAMDNISNIRPRSIILGDGRKIVAT